MLLRFLEPISWFLLAPRGVPLRSSQDSRVRTTQTPWITYGLLVRWCHWVFWPPADVSVVGETRRDCEAWSAMHSKCIAAVRNCVGWWTPRSNSGMNAEVYRQKSGSTAHCSVAEQSHDRRNRHCNISSIPMPEAGELPNFDWYRPSEVWRFDSPIAGRRTELE